MPAILIPILLKAAPYVAVLIAAIVAYFGIRHQGAKSATAKAEAKQAAVRAKVEKKIDVAVSKDEAIDQKVEKQLEAIKKIESSDPINGDRFNF